MSLEARSVPAGALPVTGSAGASSGSREDPVGPWPDDAEAAEQLAQTVASGAGVVVRPVSELTELDEITGLYAGIWRGSPQPPVTTELLRAMAKAGSYVAGAYDGGELVGACIGFFSAPAEHTLHSHIAGVSASSQRRAVGFAMKLHQRAWALRRDVSMVEWTYDPLVSRNAYFNIAKLGATVAEYLPNFYGPMGDAINGDDDSDRIMVHWHLRDEGVVQACAVSSRAADVEALRAAGAEVALGSSPDGAPVVGQPGAADVQLVAVPRDIESLRLTDPALANAWRITVRDTLVELLDGGRQVTGFDRSGWYVLTR